MPCPLFLILSLSFSLGEDRLGLRRDRTSQLSLVGRNLNADSGACVCRLGEHHSPVNWAGSLLLLAEYWPNQTGGFRADRGKRVPMLE